MKSFLEAGIVMKVGCHAGEDLLNILERKQHDITRFGYCLWGYGGSCCHPEHQVQKLASTAGTTSVGFVGIITQSRSAFNIPNRIATHFSKENLQWQAVPKNMLVTGSKWALVLSHLSIKKIAIDLHAYEVAVGPSKGKLLHTYLNGRVDKACVTIRSGGPSKATNSTNCIVGTLSYPYAVYLMH